MSTYGTGSLISSILPLITVILSCKLFLLIISTAKRAISAFSIAYTCFAPARAAKIESIPVPQPMSNTILSLSQKACAKDILYLLHSGIKNAINNFGVEDVTNLYIKEIRLGRGRHMKRFEARARGRSNRIIKHSSNLVIILNEKR